MYVKIVKGRGKGEIVKLLADYGHMAEVVSPYGTEWTLNADEYESVPNPHLYEGLPVSHV